MHNATAYLTFGFAIVEGLESIVSSYLLNVNERPQDENHQTNRRVQLHSYVDGAAKSYKAHVLVWIRWGLRAGNFLQKVANKRKFRLL
jgi:hypothetical protein